MNDGFNINYDNGNQNKEIEINKGKNIFEVLEIEVYEVIFNNNVIHIKLNYLKSILIAFTNFIKVKN